MALLEVAEAEVRFGGVHCAAWRRPHGGSGAVTGLIGPNGAGKTTLFNAICGLQTLNGGRITLDGAAHDGLGPHKRARLGIGRTFQRLEVFSSLAVWENVLAAAEIRRRWARDRSNVDANATDVLALVGLRRWPAAGRYPADRTGPAARAGPGPGHPAPPAAPRRALVGLERVRERGAGRPALPAGRGGHGGPPGRARHGTRHAGVLADQRARLRGRAHRRISGRGPGGRAVRAAYLGAVDDPEETFGPEPAALLAEEFPVAVGVTAMPEPHREFVSTTQAVAPPQPPVLELQAGPCGLRADRGPARHRPGGAGRRGAGPARP